MTRTLPHDPYITAVVRALLAAGLEPDGWWTSDTETNRYDGDGLTTQLDAVLNWGPDHPALDTSVHEDGIALVWEHPAGQWQWAPRKQHGELEREPEFLVSLPRWADPAVVVIVVRELLAGCPVPTSVGPLWLGHEEAQAAVDAWAAVESTE
ncbi:hypothetical protein [Streptomyces ossamyceticus]|uniref:hypothetical protein n=1 Tax=Streptomyces ossamyceticus TaxID=249581 RepID=UPI0006E3EC84|nr:hypothetical protein [Streptomyces ossamyceticus]